MDWLNHPSYRPLRSRLIERLRAEIGTHKRLRKVVFLCGASRSPSRDWLADYIRQYHENKLVFYADEVWALIASLKLLNALQMEDCLASLADAIVIIVESPGTFSELGAFSLRRELREKILAILDSRYESANSFINTGPIAWINKESLFKPAIYTNLSAILRAAGDIDERLRRLPEVGRERDVHPRTDPRVLLFLLCDILTVIGPAPDSHCSFYIRQVVGGDPDPPLTVPVLLGLARSMKLIDSSPHEHFGTVYYRPLERGALPSLLLKDMFSLSRERARFLSVLLKIHDSREAVLAMGA